MLNRPEYPRPEYPRPDRQRGGIEGLDWFNLNGPWDFCFDGNRRGVDEQWFHPGEGPWGGADRGAVLLGVAGRLGAGGLRRQRPLLRDTDFPRPFDR